MLNKKAPIICAECDRAEIRDAFGLKKEYCRTCKHWSQANDESQYGKCEYEQYVSVHRSDSCEKYEGKGTV